MQTRGQSIVPPARAGQERLLAATQRPGTHSLPLDSAGPGPPEPCSAGRSPWPCCSPVAPADEACGALAPGSRRARRGLGSTRLHLARIGHLQLGKRVAERSQLVGHPALEDLQQRFDSVDRIAHLLQIAARRRLGARPLTARLGLRARGQSMAADVQQRDGRLQHHVRARNAAEFRLIGRPQLLFARLPRGLARPRARHACWIGAHTVTSCE